MGNSFDSALYMQIVSDKVLEIAGNILPAKLATITTDVSSESANPAMVINVPVVYNNVSSKTFTGSFGKTDHTISNVPVTLTNKYQDFTISSLDTGIKVERIVESLSKKLADDVVTDIFSLVTASNFTETAAYTNTLGNWTYTAFNGIRNAAAAARMDNPTLLLASDFFGKTLSWDQTKNRQYYIAGDDSAVELDGVKIAEQSVIPTASNVSGAILSQDAIVVANRSWVPMDGICLDYKEVIEPKTGLRFGVRFNAAPDADGVTVVITCLYGKAVGNAAKGLLIKTA
jgi:hypothetical protein